MNQGAAGSHPRHRVLLAGDPSARPFGLVQELIRAGFQLVECERGGAAPKADAILVTLKDIQKSSLAGLDHSLPLLVLIDAANRDAPAQALALGAADALAGPVHYPDLCARLRARIRERQEGQPTAPEPLDRRMQQEFERARRYSLSFSLVLLGIEELREIEQRGGSEEAGRLRRAVVETLRRELRLPDFVVPHGASEFAIVLPETGQTGARQSVLRVRERLAVVPYDADPRLPRPRFSAGIATYPHPAVSQTDELVALAEAALMRGRAQAGERIGVAI
ncbi:MAG TPA: diguanylate cyclase [Gemmatimonadales bacterium]